MALNELLTKYSENQTLKKFLDFLEETPNAYATVNAHNTYYKIEPTLNFYRIVGASKTNIILDKKLELLSTDCGCLEHYKKKECMHTIALYAAAIAILNKELFDKEVTLYKNSKVVNKHKNVLSKLSTELKRANAFFGLIHLVPIVEAVGNNSYKLSLKVGADKDYVVKDILEFISLMENNKEYTYGQKLSFVHSYECLDDVSKEFYNFLTNIATETTSKSVDIRKSHLLKVLEIYNGYSICFASESEDGRATEYRIVKSESAELLLNKDVLKVFLPTNPKPLVCGVNNAYFISSEMIYQYPFKSRLEAKIFNALFKVDGELLIDADSQSFIADLFPVIKSQVRINESFFEKYPIPKIKIDSYVYYESGVIKLEAKRNLDKEIKDSPYIDQIMKSYYETVEGFGFKRDQKGPFTIVFVENQYRFLTSDLSVLKGFGEVFFDDSMKNLKAKKSSKTKISVSFDVGLLDFKFENATLSAEEIKAMLIAYHQRKKFVKLADDTIIEIDEADVKEIDNFLEDFNISVKDLGKKVTKPMNYLLKLVSEADKNISYSDEVYKMIQTIQNYKESKLEPPLGFRKYLREYQTEGYKWLKTLSNFGFGGILADDMGLGKTLEIITFLESDSKQMPSIIVCPMSLVYNWENECSKWGISADVKLVLGAAEERENIIASIDDNKKVLYITSYDSLRRDVSLYKAKFRFVIADEAQFIKNQYAQKSEAIKSLTSEINFALTGTPIENGLADLWSIFDYLMPGYLSSYSHFKSRYESLIVHDDKDTLDLLKKRVAPFILRRTKKDVLKDLPDKIEDYYYCKMGTKQKEVYDAYVEKLKNDINSGGNNILSYITRLRQICITPELIYQEAFENTKIDMALDLIKSSIDSGHRILVFSQFSQCFPILSKKLEEANIRHYMLDGQTKPKTRIEMVEEFNKNEDIKVFVISLKAGGTGLNLTGADMVIHIDPWWNSSAEVQATDRAYRIGQTKNVYVIKLICKDTIEEKVVKLQALKKELADSIINSDEMSEIKITKNDILELLE